MTDGEQRSSLAVVRALGRAGYQVEVCSSSERPLAGASRYCAAVHTIPSAVEGPAEFLQTVGELIARRGTDVLIPITDGTVSVALALRSNHRRLVIPFPEADTWDQVSDKRRLMEAAARLGVPVPRQVVANDPREGLIVARELARSARYPLVLKPYRSAVVVESRVARFGVRIAHTDPELAWELGRYAPEAYPILIQERIEGPGMGAFFLADEGRLITGFAHRRLREKPPTGGVSVVSESVPLRADLEEHASALLQHFRWSGVAMVEFKEDRSTGTPYLMEINGRFWGSLQLAIDAGIDFPSLLVRSALGEDVVGPESYRVGVRNRWLWGDVDHLLWILRAPRGYRDDDPSLPGRLTAMGRFLVPWLPGQRYQVLKPWDPHPFARETGEWFRSILEKRWPGRR